MIPCCLAGSSGGARFSPLGPCGTRSSVVIILWTAQAQLLCYSFILLLQAGWLILASEV